MVGEAVASAAARPELATGIRPMLHDIVISAAAVLITIAPMAISAWYEAHEEQLAEA
jgi:hypothetical protein